MLVFVDGVILDTLELEHVYIKTLNTKRRNDKTDTRQSYSAFLALEKIKYFKRTTTLPL